MEHDDAEDLPSITSIASTVLAAPPSCVAFVPHHENIVIVGTYSLHEASSESESNERTEGISVANKNESQSRSGSLIILEWAQGEAQYVLYRRIKFAYSALRMPHLCIDISCTVDIS